MADAFADAAARLQDLQRVPTPPELDLRRLEPQDVHRAIAIDGSHAVLADTGAVWVVAVRAQAVTWPGPAPVSSTPLIHVAAADDAARQVAWAYETRGLEAPRVASAEAFAETLRDLAEMDATVRACRQAGDALVLVDGALENLDPHAQPVADRIHEAAASAGALLCGVAKRSRLRHEGTHLLPWLARSGPKDHAWAASVPGYERAHVVRLHAASRHIFRADADEEDALGMLVPLARDAAYLGYPYPLALAHNTVAITGQERAHLRDRLLDAVHEHGGVEALQALDDFHDVLDANVP